MNTTDDLHGQGNGSKWQLLGERELPAGMDSDRTIHTWLVELVAPLELHEDFLNRFLQSVRDAADGAFQDEAGRQSDHIHLVIYALRPPEAEQGSWGFFQVGKMLAPAEEPSPVVHSIEFYLYVEGKS